MRKPPPRRQKPKRPYTIGEWNKLTDSLLHPLIKQHPEILVLDTAVHFIIEQNPLRSAEKFVSYTLPTLFAEVLRRQRRPRT